MILANKYKFYSSRFYEYKSEFTNFKDISDEKFEEIKDKVNYFKKNSKYLSYLKSRKLDAYTLLYAHIYEIKNMTYDEKVLFVILTIDDNLEILKSYRSQHFISNKTISHAKTNEEKIELTQIRKEQIRNFILYCHNTFGFYAKELVEYEQAFYEKYVKSEELLKSYALDKSKDLFDNIELPWNFDQIDEECFNNIKDKVSEYLKVIPNPTHQLLIYHLLCQNSILKLNNIQEQLLFFILTFDPELKTFQIYEEESKFNIIEERCLEELSFYNRKFIEIEKEYAKRFAPDIRFF